MVDRNVAKNLYEQGLTLQTIGHLFGVSRQRVWQVLKPIYTTLDTSYRPKPRGTAPGPRKEELLVMKYLQQRGYSPIPADYNDPYDIILLNGKRIEVKHRRKPIFSSGSYYWKFNYLRGKENVDFYIFVVGCLLNPTFFIVPQKNVENILSIAVTPKNKNTRRFHRKYRDNWQILKK